MNKAILILDCGATNVKACLVDGSGKIMASHAMSNETVPDPNYKGGLIWDLDDIWRKLSACSRKICHETKETDIMAVAVTTFGVDGAAMKMDGSLCYPVISWQCTRTEAIKKNITRYYDPDWLYETTGLQSYHFNTIHKLIWMRENRPDVFENMDYYVLMPSLIVQRLTGEFVTDTTMAGTSMLTSLINRDFSNSILQKLGLDAVNFPPLVEPGAIVGKVTREAAGMMGIQTGTRVVAAGHDTQFAMLGSGAGVNQPVLSSGTWEILMVRSKVDQINLPSRNSQVTVELDAKPGLIDAGIQWVASGALEWIARLFYSELEGLPNRYEKMISETQNIPAGSAGVTIIPELFPGGFSGKAGDISGFTNHVTRAHFYRACLEALSYYAGYGLDRLQQIGNYQAESVICVGGGSMNPLWNQIRCDVLGIPLKVSNIKETTAIGAAMVGFAGLGEYHDVGEAIAAVKQDFKVYKPGINKDHYRELYLKYVNNVFRSSSDHK